MSARVSSARCSLRGYTPFETLSNAFDGVDSVHRAKRVVSVAPGTCRTHWSDWRKVKAFVPHLVEAFPMEGEGKPCFRHKLRLFYRYKNTPPIELLAETAYIGDPTAEDAKEVRWRSVEGFPHAGCVKFLPLENEQEGCTSVELEFTYRMPEVLVEFLGRHPIQADVDALVQKSMDRFVQICEEQGT